MTTDRLPRGPGLFRIRTGDGPPLVTSIRRLAGTDREPGAVLVTAGMALLALLDGGLLYVVFAAQDRFIFAVKHQNVASMIQALALDVAMIIFSVLGLGLARRGLAASSERACIVVCALASAFMNWTASNPASFRSVAVYVSAPILLALTTDRTISVVRRHVLGMREDGSVWARLGRGIGRTVLYTLRLVVDLRATRSGIRQAILRAAPLPEDLERAAEREDLDMTAVLREELTTGLERIRRAAEADLAKLAASVDTLDGAVRSLAQGFTSVSDRTQDTAERVAALGNRVDLLSEETTAAIGTLERQSQRLGRLELEAAANGNGASVYPSKKAHLLALYRQHGEHGRREVASRVAGELAEAAGLQPGTARAYVYEELARLAGDSGQARHAPPGRAAHGPRRE